MMMMINMTSYPVPSYILFVILLFNFKWILFITNNFFLLFLRLKFNFQIKKDFIMRLTAVWRIPHVVFQFSWLYFYTNKKRTLFLWFVIYESLLDYRFIKNCSFTSVLTNFFVWNVFLIKEILYIQITYNLLH